MEIKNKKKLAGWIEHKTDRGKTWSSVSWLLWLWEDSWFMSSSFMTELRLILPSLLSKQGRTFPSYRKTYNLSIVSGPDATLPFVQPASDSNVTTNPSSWVCFGQKGWSWGQVKAEINKDEKVHVSQKGGGEKKVWPELVLFFCLCLDNPAVLNFHFLLLIVLWEMRHFSCFDLYSCT